MIKASIELFCRIQWKWIDFEIISNSKEEAINIINKEYPVEYRYKPYSENEDSFKIEYIEEANYFIIN